MNEKTKFRCGKCALIILDPAPIRAKVDGRPAVVSCCPKCGEILMKTR